MCHLERLSWDFRQGRISEDVQPSAGCRRAKPAPPDSTPWPAAPPISTVTSFDLTSVKVHSRAMCLCY